MLEALAKSLANSQGSADLGRLADRAPERVRDMVDREGPMGEAKLRVQRLAHRALDRHAPVARQVPVGKELQLARQQRLVRALLDDAHRRAAIQQLCHERCLCLIPTEGCHPLLHTVTAASRRLQ